jgi:hypothetical protein
MERISKIEDFNSSLLDDKGVIKNDKTTRISKLWFSRSEKDAGLQVIATIYKRRRR